MRVPMPSLDDGGRHEGGKQMNVNAWARWLRLATLTLVTLAVAACAIVSVMPPVPALRVRFVLVLGALGCLILGVGLNRPNRTRPWWLLASGMLASALGDFLVLRASSTELVTANVPADAWLTSLAGLLILAGMVDVTRMVRGADPGSTLDALVLALASGTLLWQLGVAASAVPGWAGSGTEVAGALQVLFLVGVVGLLGRTLRAIPAGQRVAAGLLVLAVTAALAAFLLGALREASEGMAHYAGVRAGTGVLANLAAGAAAVHPSMRALTQRRPAVPERLTPARTIALGLAMLTPAVLLLDGLLRGRQTSTLTLAAAWVLLVPTVLARLHLLGRSVVHAQRLASSTQERLVSLVAHTGDLLLLVRPDGSGVWRITYASPSAGRVLGSTPARLESCYLHEVVLAADRAALGLLVDLDHDEPLPRTTDLRAEHADGRARWLEAVADSYPDDDEVLVLTLRDITQRKEAELHWEQAAVSDHLTGLVNRRGVEQHLEAVLGTESPGTLGVLMLDLDGFKAINDVHGHDAGDRVLREIGARLIDVTREHDLVGRLGGDEFLVVSHGLRDRGELDAIAGRLILEVGEPLLVDGVARSVGLSVGAAMAEPGDSVGRLLRRADVALYASKAGGRGRVTVAAPEARRTAPLPIAVAHPRAHAGTTKAH